MNTYQFYTAQGMFTFSALSSYSAVQMLWNEEAVDLEPGDTMASWIDHYYGYETTVDYHLAMLEIAHQEVQQEIDYLVDKLAYPKSREKWVKAHTEQFEIERRMEYFRTTKENPFDG